MNELFVVDIENVVENEVSIVIVLASLVRCLFVSLLTADQAISLFLLVNCCAPKAYFDILKVYFAAYLENRKVSFL